MNLNGCNVLHPRLRSHVMVGYPRWLATLVAGVIVAYLNYWMWDDARIVFGMPVNLLYHVVLSVALVPIMVGVVRRAWPRYLSDD